MAHPTLLTIARIEERYKGHDVMVRALALVRAKVPDAQWIVIGDGSLRPGPRTARRLLWGRRLDPLPRRGVRRAAQLWLRRAQLLAMPSRLPAGGFAGEGFGIVYLEAGAYGKPVVAGNVAGALDAVLDGETGLLVDPDDPVAVADAIATLLLDPELAGRLGRAGQERAQGYAWPAIVARVERVLLEQLDGARRTAAAADARLGANRAREGPLRQPHRRGQRRRALAARACSRRCRRHRATAAGDTPGPARGAVERAGQRGHDAITGTAGSLRLHPLHTPRALAEVSVAASQVRRAARRHGAELIHANSIRAGIVLGLARGAERDGRARARLPAARSGHHRHDAPDRRHRDDGRGQLALHGRARSGRRRPERAWRLSTIRWTWSAGIPRASTAPGRVPLSVRRVSAGCCWASSLS